MKDWSFFTNPFLTATDGSFVRAYVIGEHTMNALNNESADPAIAAMAAALQPLWDSYSSAFLARINIIKAQTGTTLTLDQVFEDGRTLLNRVAGILLGADIFEGTPEYLSVLGRNRDEFYEGFQTTRIAAYKALIDRLTTLSNKKPAVTPAIALAQNYAASIDTANTTQDNTKNDHTAGSVLNETNRVSLCIGLLGVLGLFVDKNKANPTNSARYFRLDLIRSNRQSVFTGHLDPGEMHLVAKRTLKPEATVTLINGGAGPLNFWLALTKTDSLPDTALSLPPLSSVTVPASALGNVETNHFLMVQNPADALRGAWEVDI